ncbi:MAG: hypothetical protein GYB68_18215 [Chloroflexi bacterium]|nr:hypothetical protein [Chloroflexota bacterium]
MHTNLAAVDRVVQRVLFIKPQALSPIDDATPVDGEQKAENAFGWSLVFTGLRCTLQYAVLPFVLPVLGVAGAFSTHISLAVNLIAMIALVASLRHLWQIDYKHKWRYLALAVPAFGFLVGFLVLDLSALLA